MKSALFLLALAISGIAVLPAAAQDNTVKVSTKGMKIRAVQTPQFDAGNVGARSWRPKNWLELDVQFEVRLAPAAGGRNGSLDAVTINYYLGFPESPLTQGKKQMIRATINYADVPASEECHGLAFVAPSTLRKILQRDNFTENDVQAWGYEIVVNGETVAGQSSTGSGEAARWWTKDSVMQVDGLILPKKETPFSILWGDYDLAVKK
jgi:hypothetical protein